MEMMMTWVRRTENVYLKQEHPWLQFPLTLANPQKHAVSRSQPSVSVRSFHNVVRRSK